MEATRPLRVCLPIFTNKNTSTPNVKTCGTFQKTKTERMVATKMKTTLLKSPKTCRRHLYSKTALTKIESKKQSANTPLRWTRLKA